MPTSREPPSSAGVLSQIREALGLGAETALSDLTALPLDALLRHTRSQLLECATRAGLTGLTRLTKEVIAERFHDALAALGVVPTPSEAVVAAAPEGTLPQKFELGLPPEPETPPAHIPWSYGQDRVTAIVVDPDRLYVYWELTDDAIARARTGLGAGGQDAWPSLRVYDVTGRLFDGTNAHGYVDYRVERSDRQWFFDLGRPTSTAIVEVGLKSREGYFVRIARSGRADFPRREPAPPDGVEWLTVRTATGDVDAPTQGTGGARGGAAPAAFEPAPAWDVRQTAARSDAAPEQHVVAQAAWDRLLDGQPAEVVRTLQWEGPVERTEWEAGPFPYPVAAPVYVEERFVGPVTVTTVDGATHVVHGRWQVTIRGIDPRGERHVLARWELRRTWDTTAGSAALGAVTRVGTADGSGHLAAGASERRWQGASEQRLGGASELWRVGASERRLGGASEQLIVGSSERLTAGASERTMRGASERVLGGASERSGAYPAPPAPKG